MSADRVTSRPAAAKLARPTGGDAVLRPDTLPRFRDACRRRLTLVCAPAGYGKTTATAAVAELLGLDTVWYRLDVLDRDPSTLVASLVHAFRRRFPQFGQPILDRLSSATEAPFPVEEMCAMFVTECEAFVDVDLHVVLDDVHEVSGSPELSRGLDYLLVNLPENVRFIMLSRYEPAVSLARMRLNGTVAVVDADALRFTTEQAHDVLAGHTNGRQDPAQVDRLVELTEGWPASIVLAGLAMDWLDAGSLESALTDPRLRLDVYSYLVEQVFLRESAATRDFLLSTCCLETVTAELADSLVAGQDSARRLGRLAADRVFTFADQEAGAYRYHNLFRDFLRYRYVHERGKAAFRSLQCRTAEVLEAAGDSEHAIELLLTANEPFDAVAVIARAGESGLDRCATDRLGDWRDRLRPGPAAAHPWVRLLAAQTLTREGNYEEALEELERALATFAASSDEWGTYHALSMKESTLFWKGDLDLVISVCRQALEHAQSDDQRVHTLLSLASGAAEMRRWDDADAAFEAAEALSHSASKDELARAQALKGHAQYFRGLFRDALRTFGKAGSAEAPIPQWNLHLSALNMRGLIEMGLGQYGSALRVFSEARETAQAVGHVYVSDMILDNMGLLYGAREAA